MKHIIITLLILHLTLHTQAQDTCAQFEWANAPASTNENWGLDIYSDTEGNTYTTGYFKQNITFGSTTLSSTGGQDMYVVKTDPQGQCLWAARAGGNYMASRAFGSGVSVDSAGNSYVKGYFQGSVSFGSIALTNISGYEKYYVTKLDPNGQFLWVIETDSVLDGGYYSRNLVTDPQGNSYIYGRLSGTSTFGSITLTATQQNHIFVAKINTQGQYEWAVNIGGSAANSFLYPSGISLDNMGNILITGGVGNNTFYIGSYVFTTGGGGHSYIAKLNSQGQVIWATYAKRAGNPLSGYINNCTDLQGNCYITATFKDTAEFGNITLIENALSTNTAYIAKLDPNGQFVAAVKVGSDNVNSSISGGIGISTDANGNCYFTGTYRGTAVFGNTVLNNGHNGGVFVAKLGTQELDFEWAISADKLSQNFYSVILSRNIANDSAGNCYITGHYRDSVQFGNTLLYFNNYNSYIAKVSSECPTDILNVKENLESVTIYPNPAYSQITITNLPLNSTIHITDISGRVLYTQYNKNNSTVQIPVNGISNGVYFVQIINGVSKENRKVVVRL